MAEPKVRRRRAPAKRACIVFTCTECGKIVPLGLFVTKGCPYCGNNKLAGRAATRETQERIAKWSQRKAKGVLPDGEAAIQHGQT